MGIILILWLGMITGSIAKVIEYRAFKTAGTLRIDHSNPEKDLYRFDIDDLDSLTKKKRIMLKVDSNADLSHE